MADEAKLWVNRAEGNEEGEFFLPEMMAAALGTRGIMKLLQPLLTAAGTEPVGTAILGTVKGDLHDIGKNLVGMMCEGAGFDVINLGFNVSPEKFVDKARELKADVVGMSSLLTTGDPHLRSTVEAFKASELNGKVKLVCGGAAVTKKFAVDECGADGHATDDNGGEAAIDHAAFPR